MNLKRIKNQIFILTLSAVSLSTFAIESDPTIGIKGEWREIVLNKKITVAEYRKELIKCYQDDDGLIFKFLEKSHSEKKYTTASSISGEYVIAPKLGLISYYKLFSFDSSRAATFTHYTDNSSEHVYFYDQIERVTEKVESSHIFLSFQRVYGKYQADAVLSITSKLRSFKLRSMSQVNMPYLKITTEDYNYDVLGNRLNKYDDLNLKSISLFVPDNAKGDIVMMNIESGRSASMRFSFDDYFRCIEKSGML